MQLFLWGSLFVISLATLIVVADFFIRSAERVGIALGIPDFIVGVTIVAMGTSLPELVTSVIAVMEDASELVPGNVIGSNIANICLVLGIVGLYSRNKKMDFNVMRVDLPMLIGSTFFLGFCVWDLRFTYLEGIIAIILLAAYIGYIFSVGREERRMENTVDEEARQPFSWKEPLILLVSAFCIYLSAKYLVYSITQLSEILKIGEAFIGLTMVALGTSLPELIVSIVAAKKGQMEMAVGNILGSNIFNIFAVMGLPSLIDTIRVPAEMLQFSLPMVLATSILAFFIIQDKIIKKWEGMILLACYILFLGGSMIQEL